MESLAPSLAILLIGIGLLLLLTELFFPSGILLVLAVLALLAGLGLPFFYGETTTGVVNLVTTVLLLTGAIALVCHYWPRSAVGKRMILSGPEEDVTVASMPVLVELEQFRGRVGKALSPLRPSGTADFDGRRLDVLTEGIMVEPGTPVRCVDVRAGKVIVRPVEGPRLSDLEKADFS